MDILSFAPEHVAGQIILSGAVTKSTRTGLSETLALVEPNEREGGTSQVQRTEGAIKGLKRETAKIRLASVHSWPCRKRP